jgi:hypothetical protein
VSSALSSFSPSPSIVKPTHISADLAGAGDGDGDGDCEGDGDGRVGAAAAAVVAGFLSCFPHFGGAFVSQFSSSVEHSSGTSGRRFLWFVDADFLAF